MPKIFYAETNRTLEKEKENVRKSKESRRVVVKLPRAKTGS
jgi:hypothetical protein